MCLHVNPKTNSLKLTLNLGTCAVLYDCQNDVIPETDIIQTLEMMQCTTGDASR